MICTSSERDLGWLAGLLEGEGSFGANRTRNYYPKIQLGSTDRDVVERAHAIAGVGTLNGPYSRGVNKEVWCWNVAAQADAAGLMMTLYPLIGLRRQARIREILLEWRSA